MERATNGGDVAPFGTAINMQKFIANMTANCRRQEKKFVSDCRIVRVVLQTNGGKQ